MVLLLIEQMRERLSPHQQPSPAWLPEHSRVLRRGQQAVWQKGWRLCSAYRSGGCDLAREVLVEESLMSQCCGGRRSRDDCDCKDHYRNDLCSSLSECAGWIGCAVQPARRISAIPPSAEAGDPDLLEYFDRIGLPACSATIISCATRHCSVLNAAPRRTSCLELAKRTC